MRVIWIHGKVWYLRIWRFLSIFIVICIQLEQKLFFRRNAGESENLDFVLKSGNITKTFFHLFPSSEKWDHKSLLLFQRQESRLMEMTEKEKSITEEEKSIQTCSKQPLRKLGFFSSSHCRLDSWRIVWVLTFHSGAKCCHVRVKSKQCYIIILWNHNLLRRCSSVCRAPLKGSSLEQLSWLTLVRITFRKCEESRKEDDTQQQKLSSETVVGSNPRAG